MAERNQKADSRSVLKHGCTAVRGGGALVDSVVALFVDPRGHYPGLVTRWYDEKRDAMKYAGALPVVAHPPCQLWVNLACVNFKRYGGEHNRPGNDGGKFAHALACVRLHGGVLEHPAGSRAWAAYSLRRPEGIGWDWLGDDTQTGRSEYVCEVWQSAYGHKARKRTWLFYSGSHPPFDLRWERPTGTHQVGWFDRIKPTLSKREASETPKAFAEDLVRLAIVSRIGSRKDPRE